MVHTELSRTEHAVERTLSWARAARAARYYGAVASVFLGQPNQRLRGFTCSPVWAVCLFPDCGRNLVCNKSWISMRPPARAWALAAHAGMSNRRKWKWFTFALPRERRAHPHSPSSIVPLLCTSKIPWFSASSLLQCGSVSFLHCKHWLPAYPSSRDRGRNRSDVATWRLRV